MAARVRQRPAVVDAVGATSRTSESKSIWRGAAEPGEPIDRVSRPGQRGGSRGFGGLGADRSADSGRDHTDQKRRRRVSRQIDDDSAASSGRRSKV